MTMNMDNTTIILDEKSVTTAILVDSLMIFEMDTRLTLTVESLIMTMIAMVDHQIDIQNLILLTIMVADSPSLLDQETGPIHGLIPSMDHHQVPHVVSFEGEEAGLIRNTEAVALLLGTIRTETRTGHRGVVHLHHGTIDVTIGIDRIARLL